MGKPGEHYVKGNESDTEGQVQHAPTYMRLSVIVKFIEAESRMLISRNLRERNVGRYQSIRSDSYTRCVCPRGQLNSREPTVNATALNF